MNGYSPLFRRLVTAVVILLSLSGLLMLPTVLDLRLEWDVPWRLDGGDRIGVAALHTGLGFILAAFFGALWRIHMMGNWRRKRSRVSGAIMAGLLILLTLTAVGVFYFGDETLSLTSSLMHSALGLVIPLTFSWHFITSRRLKAADAKRFTSRRSAVADIEGQPAIPSEVLATIERTTNDSLH
jgi:hypothetical protein